MQILTQFQRIAYASGAFSKSMQWNSTDLILLYFLAEIQGLGASDAGLIMLVSLIVSGILDISLALIFDHKRANFQKVILYSTPFCVLTFALLFIPLPPGASWLFGWYLFVTLMFRVGYALVDIPHNALLGSLTTDSHERTQLSTYRIFFNSLAILLFAIFAGSILSILEERDPRQQWLLVGGFSLVLLFNLLGSVLPIRHVNAAVRQHNAHSHRPDFKTAVRALRANRPFVILAAFALIPSIFLPVFYKCGVYFASVILGDEKLATWLIIGLAVGKLIALPAFYALARRQEKHHAMVLACLGLTSCFVVFAWLLPASIIPATLLFTVCGFFSGGLVMLVWSALPDTIEYGQYHSGIGNHALTFGVFHLVMRISDGLSFATVAVVLGAAGYVQPGDVIDQNQLVNGACLVSALGALGSAALLWFYPLTHSKHAEMAVSLRSERTSTSSVHR